MTLTELRYIVAVARERHFGRAADACHVSQPTLSVAVKRLEGELGVAVFERGSGEIAITPVGEQIIAQAQRTLEEAGAIRRIAQQGQDQLMGALHLGAIHTVGPYLLPLLIPELHALAPNMPLTIEEDYTARLADKLKQGELEVIIISLPFEEARIVTLPLYEEPFVAVLPSAHPLCTRQSLRIEELAPEDFLMLGAGHCFRDQVLQFCPKCARTVATGTDPQHRLEASSLETIRHMVASGMGVTVLPCTAVGADRYAQRLLAIRRLIPPAPSRRVALAWRTSFPRPRVIDVLGEAMRRCPLGCTRPLP
jgi:LysR family hydrogen peroxide-inducible transcriptional activator